MQIGVIGSDNSHAEAFSKLLNLPRDGVFAYDDVRIKYIYGEDEERTAQVARDGEIPVIVKDPLEMIGNVDAVMVVFRHGGLHARHALPFLRAGIPVWIDKPITLTTADVTALREAAVAGGTFISGGSTCKYIPDLPKIPRETIRAGAMAFSIQMENPYGGFAFYGAHLIEMALAVFGYNPQSVFANRVGDSVTAVLGYERYQVALHFIHGLSAYHATVITEKGATTYPLDIANCYADGFQVFYDSLQTRVGLSAVEMWTPVAVSVAIERSLESGKTETIEKMEG